MTHFRHAILAHHVLWQKAKVVSWFPQLACNVICQLELWCGASRQQRHVFMVKVIMIFTITFFPSLFLWQGVKAKVDYRWIKPKFSRMWAYIKLNLISLKLLLQSWNVELWMQSQKSITALSIYLNDFKLIRFLSPFVWWLKSTSFVFLFLGCILSWKDTIYIYTDIFVCYISAMILLPLLLCTIQVHYEQKKFTSLYIIFFFLTSNIIALHMMMH
jgi:hypothetical protein